MGGTVLGLHRLVSDAHRSALDHGMGQRLRRGEVEIGEDHLILSDQGILRAIGSLTLTIMSASA